MRLEEGKTYLTRAGEEVKVALRSECDSSWPFIGNNNVTYTVDGFRLIKQLKESSEDLVSEKKEAKIPRLINYLFGK